MCELKRAKYVANLCSLCSHIGRVVIFSLLRNPNYATVCLCSNTAILQHQNTRVQGQGDRATTQEHRYVHTIIPGKQVPELVGKRHWNNR